MSMVLKLKNDEKVLQDQIKQAEEKEKREKEDEKKYLAYLESEKKKARSQLKEEIESIDLSGKKNDKGYICPTCSNNIPTKEYRVLYPGSTNMYHALVVSLGCVPLYVLRETSDGLQCPKCKQIFKVF